MSSEVSPRTRATQLEPEPGCPTWRRTPAQQEFSALMRTALASKSQATEPKQDAGRRPKGARSRAVLSKPSSEFSRSYRVQPAPREAPGADAARPRVVARRASEREAQPPFEAASDPIARALAFSAVLDAPVPVAGTRLVPEGLTPELMRLVRRIAWGGERKRSIVYLEIAAGELAGAQLTIESRDGGLALRLDLPRGAEGQAWAARLGERLQQRGLTLTSIEVRS